MQFSHYINTLKQLAYRSAKVDTIYEKQLSIDNETKHNCATDQNIILIGGPGSGKGTQAKQLAFNLEIPHIATGDLFRHHLKRNTKLGQLAQKYMSEGALVPDHITVAMLEKRLEKKDAFSGFILDGFPRTLSQAKSLTSLLESTSRSLSTAIYLYVSDTEIVNRLSGRLICSNCQTPFHITFHPPKKLNICDRCGASLYQRKDDNPEVIHARLETFHKITEPIVQYYLELGLLVKIDGSGPVSTVTSRVLNSLTNI